MKEHVLSYRDSIGNKIWYLPSKGKNYYHRKNGPAIEDTDGTKWWFVDSRRHRLDGPAMEFADGTKQWWVDGKRHRLDGPAAEYADGTKEWFVNNNRLPIEEVEIWLKENAADLTTPEGQMAFKLRWI